MISARLNSASASVLVLLLQVVADFAIGTGIGANLDDNTIQFPHDSCQSELHGKFEFSTFHNANPFYDEEGTFEMLVRFKGAADGHIALTENANTSEPLYMILIGSYNNKFSEIRRTKSAISTIKISTPEILSSQQWRGFVIRYNINTGTLHVLMEGNEFPIIRWVDRNPLNVAFFSFTTYNGRVLQVAFDCRAMDIYSSIPKVAGGGQSATEVRERLLSKYDAKIPPSSGENEPTKISVGMTVNYFTLEEAEHVFLMNCWIQMSWTDKRLAFDSSVTNGSNLHFGDSEIWHPDLTLYNNAYPTEVDHYGDTHTLVGPEGTVLWVPPARLAAHCSLNMIRWPHDTHTCELKIGSWTHHGDEIDLAFMSSNNDTNAATMISHANFVNNSEWKLIKSSAVRNVNFYPCCPEPYIDITFSFTFTRISPSYVITFVLPIIFIALVNMLVFLLPPSSGEKITLGALNFLILCIFLIYLEAKVPAFGDHLPLLVLLYGCNLVLVSISLAISVIVLNLSRTRRVSSPPHCFKMFCNINFAAVLGLGHLVPFVSQTHSRLDEGVEMRYREGNHNRHMNGDIKDDQTTQLVDYEAPYMVNAEWILLASMLDRLSFIIYAVVNGIIMGICLA